MCVAGRLQPACRDTRRRLRDASDRETLLRYVLRPPSAPDKLESRPDGLVRIVLEKPSPTPTAPWPSTSDPLSLLCRLAASVPPPRHPTVRYAGVLGAASHWRARIAPSAEPEELKRRPKPRKHRCRYRPWAELLARTFGLDALACPACQGRMRLVALVRNPRSITRYLSGIGEPTQLPARSTDRGPPYWASTVLRRKALGYDDA